jgi:SAM-dependent methyltransferase
MKNEKAWVATKYERVGKKLRGSRNTKSLSISSRLMTDITASFYDNYIPKHVTGKLADIGCGHVPFYNTYKPYITENICIDWPNSAHINQYLDLTCDLNQPIPLPDSSFNTIIISEVLEHIAEPDLIWREMTRLLMPDGKILLSVPFLYRIHEAPFDFYRYTEFALKKYAEKNKLEVIEFKAFGDLPEVLTDILSKNVTKIPAIGNFLSSLIQSMCWSFIHTSWGKRISENSAKAYPLGYFMIVQKST